MMKRNGQARSNASVIAKISVNPRYRGKWLILIHGKVFPRPKGVRGVQRLKALVKRYPKDTPTIVYIPKAETLILFL